jgi:hypothetical protein
MAAMEANGLANGGSPAGSEFKRASNHWVLLRREFGACFPSGDRLVTMREFDLAFGPGQGELEDRPA